MSEEGFLPDDFLRQIMAAGEVDILVGVRSLNNRDTIQRIISAVRVGLVKYFPRERAALVNLDGGSTDGTPDLVKSAAAPDFRTLLAADPLRTMHTLTTTYSSIRGKGDALHAILAAADLLRAKACALVDPATESITPEWMDALIRPIYREGFDFLAPVYRRYKFDGLLINHILSPMIAAAYGCEIEEPLGDQSAFSHRLAAHYLNQDAWQQDLMRFAPEIWMTATALAGDFRLCQAFLGPKLHSAKASGTALASTIQQVVGSLFSCLEMHESYWASHQGSRTAPLFGFVYDVDLPPLRVNRKRTLSKFQKGVEELTSILEPVLSQPTFRHIREVARLPEVGFPDELWVKIIYEFAGAFHRSVINRDHLLQALTPLYLGRIDSFLTENHKSGAAQVREKTKQLCAQYVSLKTYLIERWNAKA